MIEVRIEGAPGAEESANSGTKPAPARAGRPGFSAARHPSLSARHKSAGMATPRPQDGLTGARRTSITENTTMHRQILPALRIATLALGFLATDAALAGPQEELNKSLARRVYDEGLNQGIFTVPYTKDFIGHAGNGTFTREGGLAEAKGWRQAFPDLKMNIDLILAENDLVAVRWTATGTNTGAGNGIPATGKPVKITGQATFRFVDGRIAEEWASGDTIGIMRQLGLLPPRAAVPRVQAASQ
jgi:predicted ester cyclase